MTVTNIKIFDTQSNSLFTVDNTKPLNIYMCGPTVYTHTHIGHLRTYMTFDIIRRVFENYFNIPVVYMMNVTNVDDKIILGAYKKQYGDDVKLNELKLSQYLTHKQFLDYANFWETNFFDALDKMHIKRPNIVSRVTEYINEIFGFVNDIDKNGMAFEKDGSVYFHGTKYANNIISNDPTDPLNFVLLKKTKPYEPGWLSKWGMVRPGWHIECSAMASSIFGNKIDIHTGGIDLKFPHHCNEVLQSDAKFHINTEDTWVSHFMHLGHLNIQGLKMGRSLKNFITVDEISEKYTHNQIRILFLLHEWSAPMDYSEDTMSNAIKFDDIFGNFIVQSNSILLRSDVVSNKKHTIAEQKMMTQLLDIKMAVDMALKNNINTVDVIKNMNSIVSDFYTYVTTLTEMKSTISKELINDIICFVKKMFTLFGLDYESKPSIDDEKLVKVISDIRTSVRAHAKDISTKLKSIDRGLSIELSKKLYDLTDNIRDTVLPSFGIKLTDTVA